MKGTLQTHSFLSWKYLNELSKEQLFINQKYLVFLQRLFIGFVTELITLFLCLSLLILCYHSFDVSFSISHASGRILSCVSLNQRSEVTTIMTSAESASLTSSDE